MEMEDTKKQKADIGLIGLAVMGENLALNMESKGFTVSVYNRTADKTGAFVNGRGQGKNLIGTYTLNELVDSLSRPRKIMTMIRAGQPVDDLIDQLIPLLDKGDLLIDGGNSSFVDTDRRTEYVSQKGLLYIGTGVSGGEEGALLGPSIMPGGSPEAWELVKPIFQAIAAQVGDSPCCEWMGKGGAGHFVKMVHNGIEYGDMQLICESYHLMKTLLGLPADDMARVFRQWNQGDLDSYLIELTGNVLAYRDEDGAVMVDKILDKAGEKGTGRLTVISALDAGIPLSLIGEAVFSRMLSARKEERAAAAKLLIGPTPAFEGEKEAFIDDLEKALYAAKIVSYAQGFALMKAMSEKNDWQLDYSSISMIWRGGCIIRSKFLNKIAEAYQRDPNLANLLMDAFFREKVGAAQEGWRRVIATAVTNGIPVPALAGALSYYDGYRSEILPANLLQAQRDYFGAHTYERIDRPAGEWFHTNWTGKGGSTTSTTYQS